MKPLEDYCLETSLSYNLSDEELKIFKNGFYEGVKAEKDIFILKAKQWLIDYLVSFHDEMSGDEIDVDSNEFKKYMETL